MAESFWNEASQNSASPFATNQHYTLPRPKPGGAHSSLNETLTIEPNKGACNLAVQINVTPSRRGFEPHLQLKYDSSGGNGPFGIGWALDQPKVVRQTSREVPKYTDADVFILHADGDTAELIPVNVYDRTFEGTSYTVRAFEPHLLKSPFRLEQWKKKSEINDIHWRHISSENVTTIFGLDSSSRIENPRSAAIYTWLASQKYDCYGNIISFCYRPEDGTGDTRDQLSGNDKYIERIQYGNCKPFQRCDLGKPLEFHFEVFFSYCQIPPFEVVQMLREGTNPNDQWHCRQDVFSSFRSGFGIQTRRLCHRILMLHHFDNEPYMKLKDKDSECLVGSSNIDYNEHARGSQIQRIVQAGHLGLAMKEKPAIEFTYNSSELPMDDTMKSLFVGPLPTFEQLGWLDMDGAGLPSLVAKNENGYLMLQNISTSSETPTFTDWIEMKDLPGFSNAKLMDFDNDGSMEYVNWKQGFFKKRAEKWESFQQFQQLPNQDLDSSRVRFIDMTGNGTGDVLVADKEAYLWYQSLRGKGFGGPKAATFANEDPGSQPNLQPTRLHEFLYLADMTGDGLLDLVRIRNGDISYWPNLGYGSFGDLIKMTDCPHFENDNAFSHSRVLLHDIDGSGTADLVYLPSAGGLDLYLNASGRSWSSATTYQSFPRCRRNDVPRIVDLFGNGTPCAVVINHETGALSFLNFFKAKKPRMLTQVVNGFGLETTFQYVSSSQLQKQNLLEGRPWRTTVPFPIQCLTRIETNDTVQRSKTVKHFAYKDGYYDDIRREFNGFSLVEEWNGPKDAFTTLYTKSWYITGSDTQYSDLCIANQDDQMPLRISPRWSGFVSREALRAAKGKLIRQELSPANRGGEGRLIDSISRIYKIDLRFEGHQQASFSLNLAEEIKSVFELGDVARIHKYIAYEVDKLGNVLVAADIYFGSRSSISGDQSLTKILLTERQVTDLVDLDYDFRAPTECEIRQKGALSDNLWEAHQSILLEQLLERAKNMVQTSLTRHFFRPDGLTDALPLGQNGKLGLLDHTSQLAFHADDVKAIAQGLGDTVEEDLIESGFAKGTDGDWYAISGQWSFCRQDEEKLQSSATSSELELEAAVRNFFTPYLHIDQFRNQQIYDYDNYWLCRTGLTLPHGIQHEAKYDYRNMMISIFTDENGNAWTYEYDALGNVARELQGKSPPRRTNLGQTQESDLTVRDDLVDLEQKADSLVGDGTFYHFVDYISKPCRSIHITKLKRSTMLRISYLDATGRLYQERSIVGDKKWLVSGMEVSTSSGSIQHHYEPFYDLVPYFGNPPPDVKYSTTILDSMRRPALQIRQDGAWSWTEHNAWSRTYHSFCDTVNLDLPYEFNKALAEAARSIRSQFDPEEVNYRNTSELTHLDSQGQDVSLERRCGSDNAIFFRKQRSVDGRVQRVYNSKGSCVVRNSYSKTGDVYYVRSADAGEQYILRSVDGHITRLHKTGAPKKSFRFDRLRRPLEEFRDGIVVASRSYYDDRTQPNCCGHPRAIKNQNMTTMFLEYDIRGNIELFEQEIHLADDEFSGYALPKFAFMKEYDLDERILSCYMPNEKRISYLYDRIGRFQGVSDVVEIQYTPVGHIAGLLFQNGCESQFEYDDNNWLQHKTSTTKGNPIQQCAYQRDIMGRILEITDDTLKTVGNSGDSPLSLSYTYDPLGRLSTGTFYTLMDQTEGQVYMFEGAHVPPLIRRSEHYTYDLESNITALETRSDSGATKEEYTYEGDSNRLGAILQGDLPIHKVNYDGRSAALGLPSQIDTLMLEWNAEQKLCRVINQDTLAETRHRYDLQGTRIAKIVQKSGKTMVCVYLEDYEATYVLENEDLAKLDDTILIRSGETQLSKISSRNGTTLTLVDHLCSVSAEIDSAGELETYRSYTPYGRTSFEFHVGNGSGTKPKEISTEGFMGKKLDPETNFSYCKNRYLATHLCRWLSPDPSGLAGGSTNLYLYADADPINKIDHDGLCSFLTATPPGTGEKYGFGAVSSQLGQTIFLTMVFLKANSLLSRQGLARARDPKLRIYNAVTTGFLMKGFEFGMGRFYQNVLKREYPSHAQDMATAISMMTPEGLWSRMAGVDKLNHVFFSRIPTYYDIFTANGPPSHANIVGSSEGKEISLAKRYNTDAINRPNIVYFNRVNGFDNGNYKPYKAKQQSNYYKLKTPLLNNYT